MSTSWLDRAKAELEQHAVTLEMIQGIEHLVKDALVKPGSDLHAVLTVIERATEAIIKGFSSDDRKLTREEANKLLADMASRRAARNAAYDAKLDDKFDGGK